MRAVRLLSAIAAVVFGGCCCQSIVPWWDKSRNVDVPEIAGRWESPPDAHGRVELCDITRVGAGTYRLTVPVYRDQGPFILSFARIDGYLLGDVTPETPPTLTMPVHWAAVVWLKGDTMNWNLMWDDEMKSAVQRYGLKCLNSDGNTTTILETDSAKLTKALRYALRIKPVHPPADPELYRLHRRFLFFWQEK